MVEIKCFGSLVPEFLKLTNCFNPKKIYTFRCKTNTKTEQSMIIELSIEYLNFASRSFL